MEREPNLQNDVMEIYWIKVLEVTEVSGRNDEDESKIYNQIITISKWDGDFECIIESNLEVYQELW